MLPPFLCFLSLLLFCTFCPSPALFQIPVFFFIPLLFFSESNVIFSLNLKVSTSSSHFFYFFSSFFIHLTHCMICLIWCHDYNITLKISKSKHVSLSFHVSSKGKNQILKPLSIWLRLKFLKRKPRVQNTSKTKQITCSFQEMVHLI